MKPTSRFFLRIASAVVATVFVLSARSQTTAITYQGSLSENGMPANGLYDFQFKVFNLGSAGSQISSTLTKGGVAASNGVFTVSLDFGALVFDGSDRWLAISVRPGDSTDSYTNLTPRQKFTSAPYAIRAGNFSGPVSASQISGVLSSNNIGAGTITSNMLAAGAVAANLAASGQSAVPSGGIVLSTNGFDSALAAAGFVKIGTTVLNDSWQKRSAVGAPGVRRLHTAVWTGQKMIVWGGDSDFPDYELDTGGVYDPATDSWTPISTNGAPARRAGHTAIWTGTEMIVWGGVGTWRNDLFPPRFFQVVDGGGRYNPSTDTWVPISTNRAPPGTAFHTAVWTGSEMIIWGGQTNVNAPVGAQTGARYNPATDTWAAMTTNGGPSGRSYHAAVWTGVEMLVCGGEGLDENSFFVIRSDGRRYDPIADTWSYIFATFDTTKHSAVWTGTEMITFGGYFPQRVPPYIDAGLRLTPATDVNSPLSAYGNPAARYRHSAIWTGYDMIVWGGTGPTVSYFDAGGVYNPGRGDWTPITTNAAPAVRSGHTALWTGHEMLVFGGDVSGGGEGPGGVTSETWSYTPRRTMHLYQKP